MIRSARVLTVAVGLMAAAATVAAPAQADPIDTSFLDTLGNAGFQSTNPTDTVALGQSVCPMLVEPGKDFAGVASQVGLTQGLSPAMASFFTGIAIQMYCPQMMSSIGDGTILNQVGALNGLSGLSEMNGMGIPGF